MGKVGAVLKSNDATPDSGYKPHRNPIENSIKPRGQWLGRPSGLAFTSRVQSPNRQYHKPMPTECDKMGGKYIVKISSPPHGLWTQNEVMQHFRRSARVNVMKSWRSSGRLCVLAVMAAFANEKDALKAIEKGAMFGHKRLRMTLKKEQSKGEGRVRMQGERLFSSRDGNCGEGASGRWTSRTVVKKDLKKTGAVTPPEESRKNAKVRQGAQSKAATKVKESKKSLNAPRYSSKQTRKNLTHTSSARSVSGGSRRIKQSEKNRFVKRGVHEDVSKLKDMLKESKRKRRSGMIRIGAVALGIAVGVGCILLRSSSNSVFGSFDDEDE